MSPGLLKVINKQKIKFNYEIILANVFVCIKKETKSF